MNFNVASIETTSTANSTWYDLYEKIGPFNTAEYLYIYTIIIILCVIMILSRSFIFFKVCMNASKSLHDNMFHKISRGVMRFFDTNPSGNKIPQSKYVKQFYIFLIFWNYRKNFK